jgi:hypothetical protein
MGFLSVIYCSFHRFGLFQDGLGGLQGQRQATSTYRMWEQLVPFITLPICPWLP